MGHKNIEKIREIASGGDSVVVLIVPANSIGDIFRDSGPGDDGFTQDLGIPEYQARFESKLSLSRIREICAEGAFPDSVDESGETVPGAYKDSKGEWKITMAGIRARQRKEREAGLKRRERAEQRRKQSESEGSTPVMAVDRPASSGKPRGGVARPQRGSWRKAAKRNGKP